MVDADKEPQDSNSAWLACRLVLVGKRELTQARVHIGVSKVYLHPLPSSSLHLLSMVGGIQ